MRARRLNTAYNVSANRRLIERYAYMEERLFACLAGWIWTTASLDHKVELGRLSYDDILHADALRRRAAELAPATEEPLQPAALDLLATFCNEVANAGTPVERLTGVFRVLKPELLDAYRQHLAETDDLLDGPTAAVLERLIASEAEHVAWGQEALAEATRRPEAARRAAEWERHLRLAWEAIGGARGEAGERGAQPAWQRPDPPTPDVATFPARDGRHRIVPVSEYSVSSMGETPNEVVRHLLYQNAYGEMEAEDVLGQLLAHTPGLPWQMRLDLARQMWDEARHAEMSWRRMEELGGAPHPLPPVPPLILGVIGDHLDPLERLIILQRTIEGRVTERHRYRVIHLARDLDDPQTARLFEYIVADERSHIGNSAWIDRLVGGDAERLARLQAVEAEAERALEDMLNRRVDTTVRPG